MEEVAGSWGVLGERLGGSLGVQVSVQPAKLWPPFLTWPHVPSRTGYSSPQWGHGTAKDGDGDHSPALTLAAQAGSSSAWLSQGAMDLALIHQGWGFQAMHLILGCLLSF